MPGINIAESDLMTLPDSISKEASDHNRDGRPPEKDCDFIDYVKTLEKGIPYKTSEIKKHLNLSTTQATRIFNAIRQKDRSKKDLYRFITDHDVSITGRGRGQKLIIKK